MSYHCFVSVYGKSVENVKAYKDIRLCFDEKTFKTHSRKPNFSRGAIYDEYSDNFSAVELKPLYVTLNKPRYVGVTVLALAKWIMYDFHYNTIMKTFGGEGDSVRLLFTDTDSLW